MCDSCLATPFFFSLLVCQPPLTKRTQREVLSCESFSYGQPTPQPFFPDVVALCTCGDVCCIVATAGVFSEPVCVLIELKQTQQAAAAVLSGVDIERFSLFTRPRGNGLHRN